MQRSFVTIETHLFEVPVNRGTCAKRTCKSEICPNTRHGCGYNDEGDFTADVFLNSNKGENAVMQVH